MFKTMIMINNLLLTFVVCFFFSCTKSEIGDSQKLGVGPMTDGDYYVAVWGNDTNSGTFDSPWATWQKAFETADAGDIVYFRGGVYTPLKTAYGNNITMIAPKETRPIGNDGTYDNPICYFNYPGETPILDCSLVDISDNRFNTGINTLQANFLRFRGLTIRNVIQPASGEVAVGILAYGCSNITYENIVSHDIGGRGFSYMGANGYSGIEFDTTVWINCDAYNCADLKSAEPGNAGDGWKFDNEAGGYFYLEGCRSWNNSDDGFDVSGSSVTIFNNCWAFAMGFAGAFDGNGFKFGGVRDSIEVPARIVKNCLAAFNSGGGFYDLQYDIGGGLYYRNNSRIYNNTSYKNLFGFTTSKNATRPWNISQYRNNIAFQNTDERINDLGIYEWYNEHHNTWDATSNHGSPFNVNTDTVTVTDEDFVSLNPVGLTGSRQVDGSLPIINFLKLAKGSDLIDAGVDLDLPGVKGIKPDMGAFESEWE